MEHIKKTVILRSQDRLTGTSSDFNLELQYALDGSYRVKHVHIPNSCYSVQTGINDKIYFYENSTDKVATLTQGFYTSSTISAAVKTAMDTASGGHNTYTVTASSTTDKLTISASNAFYFTFETNTSASARKVLGFDAENTASGTSITSTNVVDLSLTHMFYIAIKECDNNLRASNAPLKSSIYVPLTVATNSFESLNYTDLYQVISFSPTSELSIAIYNDSNQKISINGIDWSIVLEQM